MDGYNIICNKYRAVGEEVPNTTINIGAHVLALLGVYKYNTLLFCFLGIAEEKA